MGRLNTKGMGFAVASSFALVYLACVFIVHTVPKTAAIRFFNVMLVSNILIVIGIWLVSAGWEQIYRARGQLVTNGLYAYMRHPQYTSISIITLGFMVQWPTLPTLILWSFVIGMYYRLAKREEQDALDRFGPTYREHRDRTPMFLPRLSRLFSRRAG